MALAMSKFARDSTFDAFLFAEVGVEDNGMSLSLLSALARLDLDPWHEAASLRRLTAGQASERLSSLLSSLPKTQVRDLRPETVARLVGLLPKSG